MPAKLPTPTIKWTGRLPADDMEFLTALYPGMVNEVLRHLVAGYVGRLRAKMGGASPSPATSEPPQ